VDGSTSSNDWLGFIPYDDLPHRLDPPEGFVAHANNLPKGALAEGRRPLGSSFSTNHRVNRIIECLVERSPLTFDDMRLIQMDDVDITARVFTPAIIAAWDRAGADYPDLADAVSILREWDLRLSEESIGATIYQLWLIELAESCTTDHMSYRLALYTSYEDRWLPVLEDYLAGKTEIPWLEDDDEGTRDHRVLDSLSRAIERLEREAGADQSGWAWGDVHKAVFPHPSGITALIGGGSHPWGGGRYTIRVGHYDLLGSLPFENDFGAVFRAVVASVDGRWRVEAVLPPGEGGGALGPHFTDQMQLWLDGELREVAFGTTELEPVAVLQLGPE
jgi:penicillin amidase